MSRSLRILGVITVIVFASCGNDSPNQSTSSTVSLDTLNEGTPSVESLIHAIKNRNVFNANFITDTLGAEYAVWSGIYAFSFDSLVLAEEIFQDNLKDSTDRCQKLVAEQYLKLISESTEIARDVRENYVNLTIDLYSEGGFTNFCEMVSDTVDSSYEIIIEQ